MINRPVGVSIMDMASAAFSKKFIYDFHDTDLLVINGTQGNYALVQKGFQRLDDDSICTVKDLKNYISSKFIDAPVDAELFAVAFDGFAACWIKVVDGVVMFSLGGDWHRMHPQETYKYREFMTIPRLKGDDE